MFRSPKRKNLVLIGVMVAAGVCPFVAAYWFSQRGDIEVAVVRPISQTTTIKIATKSIQTQASDGALIFKIPARGVISSANEQNAFSQHSWLPPPPPPPPPQPAPPAVKPTAPPLPFLFVGALDEKGVVRRVFLTKGEQLLIVKSNDILDSSYRIDQITDSLVELTYLPLNQKQVISIQ